MNIVETNKCEIKNGLERIGYNKLKDITLSILWEFYRGKETDADFCYCYNNITSDMLTKQELVSLLVPFFDVRPEVTNLVEKSR